MPNLLSRPFQSTRPRGARREQVAQLLPHLQVSIHAPARGATRNFEGLNEARISFNPRAREGRDNNTSRVRLFDGVSIHAPARGATGIGCRNEACPQVSIHAPARGATRRAIGSLSVPQFQSTRPRGARHLFPISMLTELIQFQSTRPRGARHGRLFQRRNANRSFNPRAREGRDDRLLETETRRRRFNPRAREGRDFRTP